jgi:UDP-N-acetylmuramyl pentapeptide phosphotransferase/UDP-N-acetylglucosamine-1-phosphate transferase
MSMYYFYFTLVLIIVELAYFRLARHYGILDHPNDRSLHEKPTIRGGGIIFYLAALLCYAITGQPDGYFIMALSLVSLVGFLDDIKSLGSTFRLLIQCAAFTLALYHIDFSNVPVWTIPVIFITAVGALNTFNFMDGINGITGGYGLVAIATFVYINTSVVHFTGNDFLFSAAVALLIFCYFNFRSRAVCFAGDVGSMSIGFIVLFLVIKLIATTGNFSFVFLLMVYGIDSVLTIIHRLIRKENILQAHKLHLFQVTVNAYKIPHPAMSIIYTVIQLAVNCAVISSLGFTLSTQYLIGVGFALVLAAIYVIIKMRLNRNSQFSRATTNTQ